MSNCPSLQAEVCKIAQSLTGEEIRPQPNACAACAIAKPPQAINKITVGLALAELLRQNRDPTNLIASHGHHIRERSPLPLRVLSYAAAMVTWLREGRPVRSEQEVREIYDNKCGPCPFRQPTEQPEVSYCGRGCGCALSPDPSVRNKIFFATEHCEDGRW